jgi:hypothetical protein
MPLETPPNFNPPRIRFDATVNVGNLLTAIVMIGTVIALYFGGRERAVTQDLRITANDQSISELRLTVRQIAETQAQNQRTEDKLALTLEFLAKQVANRP